MITGTTNARIKWGATLVALLLVAQPLAAAVYCWQEATLSAYCSGDCEIHSHPAPPPAGTVSSQETACCEISPREPVSPAALSKALQRAKLSPDPDNDRLLSAGVLPTPDFIFAEQNSTVLPANHSRQSLLCTFRI